MRAEINPRGACAGVANDQNEIMNTNETAVIDLKYPLTRQNARLKVPGRAHLLSTCISLSIPLFYVDLI